MKTNKIIVRVIAVVAALLILVCMCAMFAGCAPSDSAEANKTEVAADPNKKSEYVIIRLPNDGIVEGYVDRKYTYTSGCIAIEVEGVEYFTHMANVVIFYK